MKDGFILYCSHYPTINLLSKEEKGELLDIIFQYHIENVMPEINSKSVKIAFSFLQQQFDRDHEKYLKIVDRNRANGLNGGRPQQPKKPTGINGFEEQPKKPDNDNNNDNDKDYSNDTIIETIDTSNKNTWKTNFEIYKNELLSCLNAIKNDKEWITQQELFNPNIDIILSIEKSCVNYWCTEAGWKKKKGTKIKSIDWKSTFANAISMNKVYKKKDYDKTIGTDTREFHNSSENTPNKYAKTTFGN